MGHPNIENGTPFAFEPIFIADEDLRPVVVTVIKATFSFDEQGAVWLADEQVPVNLAGEPATDAPVSSYKYEPEIALFKPATDIALIGHAHPPAGGATQVDVGIKVGPLKKDRQSVRRSLLGTDKARDRDVEDCSVGQGSPDMGNAFGGHDEAGSTPERTLLETRNPVGTGFGKPSGEQR